jgi:hypothetical protein
MQWSPHPAQGRQQRKLGRATLGEGMKLSLLNAVQRQGGRCRQPIRGFAGVQPQLPSGWVVSMGNVSPLQQEEGEPIEGAISCSV